LPRFAIIENDEVVNVIVADSAFIKESKIDAIKCGDEICPGWKYTDKKFIAPEQIIAPVIEETTDGIA
jgi:hypothetical protein